jgi:hypothetical protein
MNVTTGTLRVSASGRDALRVSTRRHQFVAGRPIEFDVDAPRLSALEYAIGAVGSEVVGGFLAFARRRRLVVHDVEAVVTYRLEHELAYLEVVGEEGVPRIAAILIKVYVASPAADADLRATLDAALARLPLTQTLSDATAVSVEINVTTQ